MRKSILRKAGSALLAALLIASSAASPGAVSRAASLPKDVEGHWAQPYIEKAIAAGIVNGYANGEFRPESPVTRAEFSHMVNQALGNTATASLSFRDVNRGDWHYSDISKAVAAGYVSGYADNTFGPDLSITRQEAAAMLSLVVPVSGHETSLSRYPDHNSVENWARPAVSYIVGKGYIGTYLDGGIHPLDTMTRSQAATIIVKLLNEETIVKTDPDVTRSGTKLSDTIYSNGVTVSKNVGDGAVSLSGCVVLGTLDVRGGGSDAVTLTDCRVARAVVQKSSGSVRLLAKGNTSVKELSAANAAVLETSGLTGQDPYGAGFLSVTAVKNAELTLKGTFPSVEADGSDCKVHLSSGKIDNLIVSSSARAAEITVDKGASIAQADVSAQSTFRGTGTISKMNAGASGITYETKPGTITVGSGVSNPPAPNQSGLTVTADPKNGATRVPLDKTISLTFNEAADLYGGKSIRNSDVEDFVQLRRDSASGTRVTFSGSINSAKKIITLVPDSTLKADTKYYISIAKNKLENKDGNGNPAFSSTFTTGDDYDDYVSYTPKNGATGVSLSGNLTVRFSEKMVNYDKSAIANRDIASIITLRKTNASGTKVAFTAAIDSAKKVITIDPDSNLEPGTKYYLSVNAKALRTASGSNAVPASSVTFTTVAVNSVPSLNLTVSSNEDVITVSASGNLSGTIYAVLLPSGAVRPSNTQVILGKDAAGNPALSRISASVSANAAREIGKFTDLKQNTAYKVCAVLDPSDASYSNSAVAEKTISTSGAPASALSSLSVSCGGRNYPVSLRAGTTDYTVEVPFGSTDALISASTEGGNTGIHRDSQLISGTVTETLALTGGDNSVRIISNRSGATNTEYTLTIRVKGNTELKSVIAGAQVLRPSGSTYSYEIPADTESVDILIEAADPAARIVAGSLGQGTLKLSGIALPQTIQVTVSSNGEKNHYEIVVTKEASQEGNQPDPDATGAAVSLDTPL